MPENLFGILGHVFSSLLFRNREDSRVLLQRVFDGRLCQQLQWVNQIGGLLLQKQGNLGTAQNDAISTPGSQDLNGLFGHRPVGARLGASGQPHDCLIEGSGKLSRKSRGLIQAGL